jgi:hypothetical protein
MGRASDNWNSEQTKLLMEHCKNKTNKELSIILNKSEVSVRSKKLRLRLFQDNETKERAFYQDSIDYYINLDKIYEEYGYKQKIFIGTLLGDSYISKGKNYKNYYFGCKHGVKQTDYVLWKSKEFYFLKTKNGQVKDGKWYFQTPMHPFFTRLRNDIYLGENKKYIPDYIIKEFDLLSFLIYYLDDGGFHKGKSGNVFTLSISSKKFHPNDFQKLSDHINKKYDLNTFIRTYKTNPENKFLYIPNKDKNIILPIWIEYFNQYNIPECMKYKVGLKYV